MAQTAFDVQDLIGKPFERGGRGPDAYDCFGLVMELMRRDGAAAIPDYPAPPDLSDVEKVVKEVIGDWKECEPRPGCVILFRIKGYGCHVGYLLDRRRFVHTWEGSHGVTIERMNDWKRRVIGYYEYAGS